MQNFNQKSSKGLNLIELLLVLGVVAILLVAAFVVYPQVRDRNQANTEISNATAIKASLTNLFASKGGLYTGLTTEVANNARAFPSSMNGGVYDSDPAVVTAAWGGAVTAEVRTTALAVGTPARTYAANRTFTLSYADVPAGVCLGLVSGAASNFVDVTVGGVSVMADDGSFAPEKAAAECSAASVSAITLHSN